MPVEAEAGIVARDIGLLKELNDSRTLWYESEESGFAHLYTKVPGAPANIDPQREP